MITGSVVVWTAGPAASTVGCNGADGFFRCDVTNSADATVAPIVSAVATAFRRKDRMASDGDRGFEEWNPVERRPEDLARV